MEKKPFDANEKKIQMPKAGRGNGSGHARGKDVHGTVQQHGVRASMRNRGKKGPLPPESRFVIGVLGHVSGMTERRVAPGVRRNSKSRIGKDGKGRIGDPGPLLLPPFMLDIPISPKHPSKPGKQDLEAEYRLERVYHKFFRRPIKPK